jgi:hypothetical protein
MTAEAGRGECRGALRLSGQPKASTAIPKRAAGRSATSFRDEDSLFSGENGLRRPHAGCAGIHLKRRVDLDHVEGVRPLAALVASDQSSRVAMSLVNSGRALTFALAA